MVFILTNIIIINICEYVITYNLTTSENVDRLNLKKT